MSLAALILGVLSGFGLLGWGAVGYQIGNIGGDKALQFISITAPVFVLFGAGMVMKKPLLGGMLMCGGGLLILSVIGVNGFGGYLSAGAIVSGVLGVGEYILGERGTVTTAASSRNESQLSKPDQLQAARYDRQRWRLLKEIDSDIAFAAHEVSNLSAGYEDALAEKYILLGDKKYLTPIVESIKKYHKQQQERMEREKENYDLALSGSRRQALIERRRRSEETIERIKNNGMVCQETGKEVSSAVMYYGKSIDDHEYALVIYRDGSAELRSGQYFMKVPASFD